MRWSALLLVPLFVVACDREPVAPDVTPTFGAATSDWTHEIYDLPAGDAFYYCGAVDDWFDEVGPLEVSWHLVSTSQGFLLYNKQRWVDGYRLVADRTGLWYPASPNQQGTYVERGTFANGSYHFHYVIEPYIYENATTGVKIRWPYQIQVTLNANGDLTVNRVAMPCDIVGK